jgi:phage terminase large subunit
MPSKAQEVLNQKARYKVLYGGRGSAKSFSIANWLIVESLKRPIRILCCREFQSSIRDSVHKLLADRIYALKLEKFFVIQRDTITGINGSEFIFRGLRNNAPEIKSMQGINYVWCEESDKISEESWLILIPTIRQEESEILITFNPEDENGATYKRFIKNPPPECISALLNYADNEYFPEVLRKEMEYCKRVDPEMYEHIWLGKPKKYGHDVIFRNKFEVKEFETPEDAELRFGADWGFSNDPTVLGRMFIQEQTLFIDWEFYAVGVEINELERAFDTVPKSRIWKITADSERPDTISHMRNKGFNIVGALKGKGSVEDGIGFLRGFERIIIHPRCKHAVDNFSNYRWKRDRVTQEILPVPAEGSDHWPDTARYALEDYIKAKELDIKWL